MISVKIIRVGAEAKAWSAIENSKKSKFINFDTACKEKMRLDEDKRRMEEERIKAEIAKKQEEYKNNFFASVKSQNKNVIMSPSGLVYEIVKKGKDVKKFGAKKGSEVKLHYTGTLFKDGTKFDSSVDRKEPMVFKYKETSFIAGFDEGISLVGPKGKVKLYIPYFLAYGDRDLGKIGPNSDLVFDIDIISVKNSKEKAKDTDQHDHSDPNHKH